MKTCQPCGAVAAAEAPHCARCGEASWFIVEPTFSPPVSLLASEPADLLVLESGPPIAVVIEADAPALPEPEAPQIPRRKRGNR